MINISYNYQNGIFFMHLIFISVSYIFRTVKKASVQLFREIIMTMLQHLIIPESQLQTLKQFNKEIH